VYEERIFVRPSTVDCRLDSDPQVMPYPFISFPFESVYSSTSSPAADFFSKWASLKERFQLYLF
jgi:hypothetical protein